MGILFGLGFLVAAAIAAAWKKEQIANKPVKETTTLKPIVALAFLGAALLCFALACAGSTTPTTKEPTPANVGPIFGK